MLVKVPFEIEWATPLTPSCNEDYLLDTRSFRIGLKVDGGTHSKPQDFFVNLWTNLYHKTNNEGEWHAVPMTFKGVRQVRDAEMISYMYGVDLTLTGLGRFAFTYQARHKFDKSFKWSQTFKIDGIIKVILPVREYTVWLQEPLASKITHNVYIGNFTAAMQCCQDGFDCCLNMADDVHIHPEQFHRPIVYKRCLLPFGVENPISRQVVEYCVQWVRYMSNSCKKVMVCSRTGHARSGSIMIAFIYFMNPDLSFQEAYEFVDKRSFVYPHKGLKETVCDLYDRS